MKKEKVAIILVLQIVFVWIIIVIQEDGLRWE